MTVTGSGLVTSVPAGIDCGQACAFAPRTGTVTLTAIPAVRWRFDDWSGNCATSMPEITVSMDADRSCTAAFSELPGQVFTLTVTATDNGHVSSAPEGIACGDDCEERFAEGALVTLTATAAPGFGFDGWSGDCAGTDVTAQVTMSADRTCDAAFSPSGGPFTLTVLISKPPGSLGAVIGLEPAGNAITCVGTGPTCSQVFAAGTVVVVRPSDSSLETGSFGHWVGCDTVGTLFRCAVVMTADRTVTATFDR